MIFFAYIGFDAVSTAAQEAKNPQKDMPVGILGSLLVCTVLYIAGRGSADRIGAVSTALNVADPIAVGVGATHLPWLIEVVKIGVIAGLSSVMLVLMYGQTRIFFTMAGDGLLPSIFSRLHPRYQTPVPATWLLGESLSASIAGLRPAGFARRTG